MIVVPPVHNVFVSLLVDLFFVLSHAVYAIELLFFLYLSVA